MSATNLNDKPHPALVWLWWIAAPVAVVTNVLRERESPSAYGWQLWHVVLFVLGSGVLLRAKAVVRGAKLGPPDACELRDHIVRGRLFKFMGYVALIGLVAAPLMVLDEASDRGRVDWLKMMREASGSAVTAIFWLSFARIQCMPITSKSLATSQLDAQRPN